MESRNRSDSAGPTTTDTGHTAVTRAAAAPARAAHMHTHAPRQGIVLTASSLLLERHTAVTIPVSDPVCQHLGCPGQLASPGPSGDSALITDSGLTPGGMPGGWKEWSCELGSHGGKRGWLPPEGGHSVSESLFLSPLGRAPRSAVLVPQD